MNPSDVDKPAEGASDKPAFLIRHVTGSRRGLEERIEDGVVGIGRGRANRIALDAEADRTVSARHAEIRIEHGAIVLYDLGSLNGTYVNGRRVRRSELADGDEIGLGREGPRLVVSRVGAGGLGPPRPAAPAEADPRPRRRTAPSGDPPAAGSQRRYWIAAVVAPIVVVGAALGVRAWSDMRDRLDALERDGGRTIEVPAATTAPTAAVVLRGAVLGADGRARSTTELGVGVHVARRAVATTDVVAADARAFLRGGGDRRIEAYPEGRVEAAVVVAGRRSAPGRADAPASVVLFELGRDLDAPLASPRPGAPPPTIRVVRPGFPDEPARVEEALSADGSRAATESGAYLLRVSATGAAAGAALLDAEGRLVGLSAGPSRPGLALGTAAIAAALEARETVDISPLN